MKKRVFITGAAGFIGFHLARHLQARGDEVIGFDNYNDYYSPQLKQERTKELTKIGVKIIKGELEDQNHLQTEIESHQTTHLVHLAAQAGVRYSLQQPHLYLKSNVEGFLNILEVCRALPSIKLTYASSSSIYGLNTSVPFSIEDQTDHQASLYGVTKKTNELMAHTYHHLFGLSVTGLRFFTVYGPWGRPDMAYFSFTKAILDGRPIDVYHEGEMWRDFTYIDDIIDGIAAAVDYEAACEIFNLGHHHPEKLLDLISILEQALGKKAKKNFVAMQPGDVITTYADIKESQLKLGFNPKVSLTQGINQFVERYKHYYSPTSFVFPKSL